MFFTVLSQIVVPQQGRTKQVKRRWSVWLRDPGPLEPTKGGKRWKGRWRECVRPCPPRQRDCHKLPCGAEEDTHTHTARPHYRAQQAPRVARRFRTRRGIAAQTFNKETHPIHARHYDDERVGADHGSGKQVRWYQRLCRLSPCVLFVLKNDRVKAVEKAADAANQRLRCCS